MLKYAHSTYNKVRIKAGENIFFYYLSFFCNIFQLIIFIATLAAILTALYLSSKAFN